MTVIRMTRQAGVALMPGRWRGRVEASMPHRWRGRVEASMPGRWRGRLEALMPVARQGGGFIVEPILNQF